MSKSKSRSVVAAVMPAAAATARRQLARTTTMQRDLHKAPQGAVPLLGAVGVTVMEVIRTSIFPNK
jgi:hypothetical protein